MGRRADERCAVPPMLAEYRDDAVDVAIFGGPGVGYGIGAPVESHCLQGDPGWHEGRETVAVPSAASPDERDPGLIRYGDNAPPAERAGTADPFRVLLHS